MSKTKVSKGRRGAKKSANGPASKAAAPPADQPIDQAIQRLHRLYEQNLIDAPHVSLGAQKELNRLLGLQGTPDAEQDDQAAGELAQIGAYLRPLGLAPDHAPLIEHARMAADFVRKAQK